MLRNRSNSEKFDLNLSGGMSFGDAAGSVVASCYIQYIALDIAAIPPLQVSFAFALASLTKCAVGDREPAQCTAEDL